MASSNKDKVDVEFGTEVGAKYAEVTNESAEVMNKLADSLEELAQTITDQHTKQSLDMLVHAFISNKHTLARVSDGKYIYTLTKQKC